EAERMRGVYRGFAEEVVAMAAIHGIKTASERDAGAVEAYSIESETRDSKAIQTGALRSVEQRLAKACDVKFPSEHGENEQAWTCLYHKRGHFSSAYWWRDYDALR